MKRKFKMETPLGNGTVQYGEFMEDDGRKKSFHCWWNGCGIGGVSSSFKKSKEYLVDFIRDMTVKSIRESKADLVKLQAYLNTISGDNQ